MIKKCKMTNENGGYFAVTGSTTTLTNVEADVKFTVNIRNKICIN